MADVIDLKFYCRKCKREIPGGSIYYDHPTLGAVCEYCPEFNDGPLEVEEE